MGMMKPPLGFVPNIGKMRQDKICLFLPFNRGGGTTETDLSGYENHGTFGATTAAPEWIGTPEGPGLLFDGVNDVINCGSRAILDNMPGYTCIAYINPTDSGEGSEGQLLNKLNNAYNQGYAFQLRANGAFQLYHTTTGTDFLRRSNNDVITYGQWQQVAVSWDGSLTASNSHLYVNGMEVGYATTTDGTGAKDSDAGNDLLIGNDVTGSYSFKGGIGWVVVAAGAWSAKKIYDYYRRPWQYYDVCIVSGFPIGTTNNEVPMRVYAEGFEVAQSSDAALRVYAEGLEVAQSPEAACRVYALALEVVTPNWNVWGNKLRRMR